MRALKIIGLVVAVLGLLAALIALITEGLKLYRELPTQTPAAITVVAALPQSTLQPTTPATPVSTIAPTPLAIPTETIQPSPQPTIAQSTDDRRDIAAQTLGYANVDTFMEAFGIPVEVKSRIFVCPKEETWCLAVFEEPGLSDFHFKNITNCNLDGKQANGVSGVPAGFDGMVKGFTARPCGR